MTVIDPGPGPEHRAQITANLLAALPRARQIRDADPAAFAGLTVAQRDSQLFEAVQDMAQAIIWLGKLLIDDVQGGTE